MSSDAENVWADVPDWGGVGAQRLVRAGSARRFALGSFNRVALSSSTTSTTGARSSSSSFAASLTVRLHDGDRHLHEGDVVPLPRGPEGGHQIRNEMNEMARVLIISSNARPDVAEYPDTGKIGLAVEGAEWEYHRRDHSVPHAGPE